MKHKSDTPRIDQRRSSRRAVQMALREITTAPELAELADEAAPSIPLQRRARRSSL